MKSNFKTIATLTIATAMASARLAGCDTIERRSGLGKETQYGAGAAASLKA